MDTTYIVDFARRAGMTDALTDLLRTGAQQLIATAVEAELASYLAQFVDLPEKSAKQPLTTYKYSTSHE
jgi:hypothetical protein